MVESNYFNVKSSFEDGISESVFDEEYKEEEELLLISKQGYTHEEDDLTFSYKYYVNCVKNYDNDKWIYIFGIVVSPQSLNEKIAKEMLDFTGLENIEETSIMDILSFGGCDVQCGCEIGGEREELNYNIVDAAANIINLVESMFGFYMDKSWNNIGTDGWDTLRHAVNGEKLFKI